MPLVSIVMPAYNAEKYIEAAIRSVLAQTFSDYELLVVDDCSKDGTAAIIRALAQEEPRIVFMQNPQNSGVTITRNFAISQAKGEWIAFLDSDDLWREDKLEQQLALLVEHPDAVLTYTASSFIDENDNLYAYTMPAEPEVTYQRLLQRNLLSCSSVMVKREIIEQFPMGDDKMCEDYAAWLRILREIPCAYGINEPLLIYRISRNSRSSKRLKMVKMLYRTYHSVGYGFVPAVFLVLRYTLYSISKRKKIVGIAAERVEHE